MGDKEPLEVRRDESGDHPVTPRLAAVRAAVARLDNAADFEAAGAALKEIALALGMPTLAWAPDVSRPTLDPHMDAFLRSEGWSDEVMALWWDRNVMLRSPIYIRCRIRSLPFITAAVDKVPPGRPELRRIAEAMRDMAVRTLITSPVHLPRGQIAMITWGGPLPLAETRKALQECRPELLAAGYCFMNAFRTVAGRVQTTEEELSRLTPREWECLRLTAQGCREEQVATLVGLGATTVRYHLDNVVRKLGATNRIHAVALAAQLGLLGPIG